MCRWAPPSPTRYTWQREMFGRASTCRVRWALSTPSSAARSSGRSPMSWCARGISIITRGTPQPPIRVSRQRSLVHTPSSRVHVRQVAGSSSWRGGSGSDGRPQRRDAEAVLVERRHVPHGHPRQRQALLVVGRLEGVGVERVGVQGHRATLGGALRPHRRRAVPNIPRAISRAAVRMKSLKAPDFTTSETMPPSSPDDPPEVRREDEVDSKPSSLPSRAPWPRPPRPGGAHPPRP